MAYAALNVVMLMYAIVAFIGVRNSLVDAWVHFKGLLYNNCGLTVAASVGVALPTAPDAGQLARQGAAFCTRPRPMCAHEMRIV